LEITVSGRRTDVSDKLRRVTEEKVARLERFVDMERAEVHFAQQKNPRIRERDTCEITLTGHGHHVRVKVAAGDGFAAVDKASEKAAQQLTKLKSKLVKRSHGGAKSGPSAGAATSTVLDGANAPAATEPEVVAGPKIVKKKRFAMMPMTPEEAVQRMDLVGHGFFFFTNIDTHRAAVVYRREDGDVGLIDEDG
jgi:putative sigma-54 modulation protein